MAQTNFSSKIGATPGKLAGVAILAIVFAFVLWNELFSDKSASGGGRELARRRPVNSAASTETIAVPPKGKSAKTKDYTAGRDQLLTYDLKSIAKHDPFRMPTHWKRKEIPIEEPQVANVAIQEAEEDKAKQADIAALNALQKRGADMIIISDSQRLAIIGNETLEIGDVYEGLRVVSIESSGLTVERVD